MKLSFSFVRNFPFAINQCLSKQTKLSKNDPTSAWERYHEKSAVKFKRQTSFRLWLFSHPLSYSPDVSSDFVRITKDNEFFARE